MLLGLKQTIWLLMILFIAGLMWNSYEEPVPPKVDPIALPSNFPAGSKANRVVFPSDRMWSGGPPYTERTVQSFGDLPRDAACSPVHRLREFGANLFTFSCGWFEGEKIFRAFVSVPLPENDAVYSWEYEQETLQLKALLRKPDDLGVAWRGLASLILPVIWFFGMLFITALHPDKKEQA